jgi:F0F1-type ATP synthase membrane subunit c/vacuolar-type H+-ATPase subunit K
MIFKNMGNIVFGVCVLMCLIMLLHSTEAMVILMVVGMILISFTIAHIAKSAFESMTKNSESVDGLNSVAPLLLGLVEPFSLIIAGILLVMKVEGNAIIMGLTLNAIPIGILGSSWIENYSKNPDNNSRIIGYGAFGCIEIASIVLMKKLFEIECSLSTLCLGIGLTMINAGIISYEICKGIGRNPSIRNQILVLGLPLLGAIDITGLVLIMKLIMTYRSKIPV